MRRNPSREPDPARIVPSGRGLGLRQQPTTHREDSHPVPHYPCSALVRGLSLPCPSSLQPLPGGVQRQQKVGQAGPRPEVGTGQFRKPPGLAESVGRSGVGDGGEVSVGEKCDPGDRGLWGEMSGSGDRASTPHPRLIG